MKNVLLPLLFLFPFIGLTGQDGHSGRHHHCDHIKCDTRVQQLDSLVNYKFNEAANTHTPAYVIIYRHDRNGNTINSKRLDLPSRTPVYNQIFYYNVFGKQSSYLYQEWKNGVWTDAIRTDYTYDEDKNLDKEVFYRKNAANVWEAYQQHFYTYEAGITVSYLRQAKNANGEWYDVSHHYYVYDTAGNLAVLYGQYLSNGEIFWKRTTIFDDKGKATERVLQTLKYDPILKKNVLKNINHQSYSYDIYGDLHELFTDEWINEAWKYTNKHIYYYSIIPGKKVAICHKGIYICVGANAVKAHLEHGDKLGPCADNPDDTCPCRGYDEADRGNRSPHDRRESAYKIYPMPFVTELKIDFRDAETGYSRVSLCTMSGVVLMSEDVEGRESVTLNTQGLKSGTYLVIFHGDNIQSVATVVKK